MHTLLWYLYGKRLSAHLANLRQVTLLLEEQKSIESEAHNNIST